MAKRKSIERKNAVIYARYSSHNQKDASIEQQVAVCQAFAHRLGIRVKEVYSDRAISGKTDKRPEFQRMLRDAEGGGFDCVIAWKSNRIGRNMLQAMLNEQRLQELGVNVLYTEEDFEDTAAGRFALRNMMNVNQFYSENMAEDIRRGLMDNAKNCKVNGAIPYGYKKGEDGCYEVHEAQAEIVLEIFKRVSNGEALLSIADDLNHRCITNKQGRPWGKNSFRLLNNERYLGTYIYSDVRIPHGIPQIVPDDLYNDVQEALIMKKNPRFSKSRRRSTNYLLTGKLFCGECRSPMIGLSGKGEHGVLYHYYACKDKRNNGPCKKNNVPKELLEITVGKTIRDYVLSDEAIEWMVDCTLRYQEEQRASSNVGLLEEELSTAEKSIQNLIRSLESGVASQSITDRIAELEDRKHELSEAIAKANASIINLDRKTLINAMKVYQNADITDFMLLKRLFDAFLIFVYVYDDKTLQIAFTLTGRRKDVELSLYDLQFPDNKKAPNEASQKSGSSLGDVWWCNVEHKRTPTIYMVDGYFIIKIKL